MKTNATSGISGTAGTPLSHQAIQSGRDAIRRGPSRIKNEAISDTLETSDREADGRRPIVIQNQRANDNKNENKDNSAENSAGLDLLG